MNDLNIPHLSRSLSVANLLSAAGLVLALAGCSVIETPPHHFPPPPPSERAPPLPQQPAQQPASPSGGTLRLAPPLSVPQPVPPAAPTDLKVLDPALLGQWSWLHLTQADGRSTYTRNPSRYTLTFTRDGRLVGVVDCNRYTTSYRVNPRPRTLEIDPNIATSFAACGGDSQDALFLQNLGFVRRYQIKGQLLELSLEADQQALGTLVFSRDR